MIRCGFRKWSALPAGMLTIGAALVMVVPALAADAPTKQATFSKDVAPILQSKCQEPRRYLSEYAVATRNALNERGVDEDLLSILTHVNASLPPAAGAMKCDGVFASYATLRVGG